MTQTKVLLIIAVLIIAAISLIIFGGMDKAPTSDESMAAKQEQLQREAEAQSGIPAVKNFLEKKQMKTIIEARDQANIANYAYLFAENTGKLIYIGRCIGYGLPYATQYTNPEKIGYASSQVGVVTLPQADPNGLFMPISADGTWLMLVDKTGTPRVTYFEPKVIVSSFPLEVQ